MRCYTCDPLNKDGLIEKLRRNYQSDDGEHPTEVNDEVWTLADLFIRQWLNNGWDGFGMVHVESMFDLLSKHKQLLIDNNMLSKDGYNNFGFPLWKNYNFDSRGEEE
jgi:hypothetical protein